MTDGGCSATRCDCWSSVLVVALLAGVAAGCAPDVEPRVPGVAVRTMTWNVLGLRGWPVRGRQPAPEVVRDAVRAIAAEAPDVLTLQEVGPPESVAALAAQLGMEFVVARGWFPGAILVRGTILDFEDCPIVWPRGLPWRLGRVLGPWVPGWARAGCPDDHFTRHWGRALVRTRSGVTLVVHGVHLAAGTLPRHAALRLAEVDLALESVEADLAAGRNLLFQGDLNARPDSEPLRRLTGAGLVDSAQAAGQAAAITYPGRGSRIDYVLAGGPLAAGTIDARVRSGPPWLNPDGSGLSDHLPVIVDLAQPAGP